MKRRDSKRFSCPASCDFNITSNLEAEIERLHESLAGSKKQVEQKLVQSRSKWVEWQTQILQKLDLDLTKLSYREIKTKEEEFCSETAVICKPDRQR